VISSKTITRLSLYRRTLNDLLGQGASNVYSHELAQAAGVTAAQVRRDIMTVGYSGSPSHGYEISALVESIGTYLDNPEGDRAALVGVGNLGGALLAFFAGRRPRLSIVAAFDQDPRKVSRVIYGCRSYPMEEMSSVIADKDITVGVITVPTAGAQEVADELVAGGVRGILNFAPVTLRVPTNIYVENIDLTTSLEKVAFYARQGQLERGRVR
jgi:redox-sensing transcriptional repressor